MRALIVGGAGAVGQVYGHHLARGDAEVSVYVRASRRQEAERGFTLTRISPLGRRNTELFRPEAVLTTEREVAQHPAFDQIWFCVPTTSFDDELLQGIAGHCKKATLVVLSPGQFVKDKVAALVGLERSVFGIIGMISYVAPLEGSDDPRERETPAGIAYLLETTKLSSESEHRALDAVTALRAGGCPADVVADASADVAMSTATLMPMVGALEIAGWSLETFRSKEMATLAADAMQEARDVAEAVTGKPAPFGALVTQPLLLQLGALVAPRVAPLDIEAFLRVHFTKVAEQTRLLLAVSVADAMRLGRPSGALRKMLGRLG